MKTVNPNRVQEKAKKVTDISLDDPPAADAGPMNRKERCAPVRCTPANTDANTERRSMRSAVRQRI
jgi:hypothetical protein